MTNEDPAEIVKQQTLAWLDRFVIGLNLCPFASKVRDDGTLHIEVCQKTDWDDLVRSVLLQLEALLQADEKVISTSLLVFSHAVAEFDEFLELLAAANEILAETQLDGVIQIASFHPDYVFEEEPEDDVSHYTNRSPYPMLHFIREAQLTQALKHFPNPEQIPIDNISCLRELGKADIDKLLAGQ